MTEALFVSLSGPDPGVFDSQVIDYGRFLRGLGIDFRYHLFDGIRSRLRGGRRAARQIEALSRRFDVRIEQRYLLRPLSEPGLRRAAGYLVAAAGRLQRGPGPLLIQARGPEATCVALEAKRRLREAVVIYDARGDAAAETRLEGSMETDPRRRQRWERRARRLEELERRACAGVDHAFAVSRPLRDHIRALGGISPESITVIPCCVNTGRFTFSPADRDDVRTRLGVQGRFVLVYSGSLSLWQIPDRVAALVRALHDRMPEVHLLLLTRDGAGAERYFGSLMQEGVCTRLECLYEEVGRHLCAADAGLLLRHSDAVNRVACPVKFAEYQTNGLPVILSGGIGDVSDDVARTGNGAVLDLETPVDEQAGRVMEALRGGNWREQRTAIGRRAAGLYSRDSYRPVYAQVLSRLGLEVRETAPDAG